ncbi:hypothetical protein EKN56_14625 [Limnobaculum zhutongyuii]|uniref:Twin-arginine translocation signal domain-containing protein n=1 Tax=Limnobaculum zhutongyuii TaxID=2498113 RepID=A0A411WMP0_9GAMM|nr:hypothetical protein [Limnobaculum zhutongyuii]QBH97529.1 hypothetical protein EKN56_14625 [Limnobaculum zhutongyuii]
MMNRRLFLTKLAAAVGTFAAAKVIAQPQHMEKMSSGHDMGNMSHHNMGNMPMGECITAICCRNPPCLKTCRCLI